MSKWSVEAWEIPGASPFQRRVMDVPGVLEFTQPASGVGRCKIGIPEDWGRLDKILDPANDVGSLLRVIQTDRSGDPQIRAEYVLRRTATPRRDAGNIVTLTAPSIEDALEWAVVYPHDWPTIPSVDPNWTWGFVSLLSTQNQGFEANPYSLINPGAEDGTTNGWPTTGTRAEAIAPETFEAIEDAGDADDGDWYFNITADTGEGVFQDFNKPLVEGETYIVSCRLFVATGETTRMEVTPAASVSVGGLFNGAAFADAVGNDAYQTVTVTFVAGAGVGGVSVLSQTDGNTFRFDKVRVEGFGVGTDDWSIRGTVDVFAVVPTTTVPAPPVHSGDHSLAWHPNSGVAGNDSLYLSQDTVPGQKVTGEIWVYHTEGVNEDFRIVLRIPGVNPNTQNVASEVFSVPTATWTLLTATGIATTTTTELELRYDETGAPASNIYVDDADFYTGQAPATIGVMGLQLLADAQTDHAAEAGDLARETLLWLKPDFTGLVDSAGNNWRAEESLTIVRGKTYGKVLSDDFAKLGYEYRVKPNPSFPGDSESHILQIFNPADLTTRVGGASNDLVASVGFSGGSVVKGPVVKTPKSRTVTLAEGDALQFAVAKDAAGVTAWGARELYLAERDVLDPTTLAQSAATALSERGAAITATRLSIVDDDVFSPFIDFDPGDWVRGELPPDLPRGNHRVVAITGTIAEGNSVFDIDVGAQVFVGSSGMNEAVSRLLSKFDGIEAPVAAAAAAGTFPDPFTGPIEVTYLVAASDARAEIRALADFVCSGTDDDVEIQATIDAAEAATAGVGCVVLTEGAFACTSPVLVGINGGCVLRGQGIDVTVLTFTMPGGSGTGALRLDSATYAAAEELSVVVVDAGSANYAVTNNAPSGGHLTNVSAKMEDSTRFGAFQISGTNIACKGLRVPTGNQGYGIETDGAHLDLDDCIVAGTSIVGGAVQGEAFYAPSGGPVTLKGCKAKSTVDDDGFVTFGFNYIYTGCVSETTSGIGFLLGGSDNVMVGNVSRDSNPTGVRIEGDRCVVAGNKILDTTGDGIEITGGADLTMLGTNLITGFSGDEIVDGGTNTVNTDWLANPFFNGTFLEHMRTIISESAGTVTLSLDATGGGDLTMRFSDGRTILDCTPAQTIDLTVGTDDVPQMNYIYIPQSTKVLTKSTSAYPTDVEHIRVATFYVRSAAAVAADGGTTIHQAWNNAASEPSGQGHGAKGWERQRRDRARWFSGFDGVGTSDYLTLAGTTVDFKSSSGVVYQLHDHLVDAHDTSAGDPILVKNWFGDAFHELTNLFDIVDDSTGTTIGNNKWFKFVAWAVVSGGDFHPYMINLPSGFYNTQAAAEADLNGYADFDIPREFTIDSSTGFLISAIIVKKQASAWVFGSTEDLRGLSPGVAATGGATAGISQFSDSIFHVFNNADNTKVVELDVSGVTTGNTRTWIVPDFDGTVTVEGVVPVKTDTGDPGSPVEGQIYVNTFDNKIRVFADAAWRDLATW